MDFFFFSIPSLFFFDLKHFFINCAFQNKIAEFCCRWCNKDIFFQNLSYLCQFAGRLQNDPNTCSGHHHFVLDLLKKKCYHFTDEATPISSQFHPTCYWGKNMLFAHHLRQFWPKEKGLGHVFCHNFTFIVDNTFMIFNSILLLSGTFPQNITIHI